MLVSGDLVRIPQGTVILGLENQSLENVPLGVSAQPRTGIVIDTKSVDKDLVKVLLDDQVFLVDKRVVQLVGG
tara:strand:- start:138 stop:356 length:219 start_codon:yes stop_codon:yes gene_type:complete